MSGTRTTQKSRMARTLRTLLAAVIMTALLAALTGCGGGSTPSSTATKPPVAGSSATGGATESAEATSAATEEEAAIMMGITPIDEAEISGLVGKGARLINVDTKTSSNAERIKGAKQIPLSKLVDTAADWRKSKAVVVTSRTQARSIVGAAYLARQGFTEVYYLFDGHDGWTGSYTGTSPRKPTDPPLCYYIYRSDYPDESAEAVMLELEEQFEALEDKYDRI
ncbi:MAG: rhodanese-like domain-containing protein, partial [Coriobacteriia bacterium]|nr:rhodanese-like domain-containing protein [Coriobacteriia bacterium]